jgi:WD40 repeat protein
MLRIAAVLILLICALPTAAQDDLLPDDLPVITLDNVGAMTRLAEYGLGQMLDAFLDDDGATLTVISARGISRYDTADLAGESQFVPFEGNPLDGFYASFFEPNVSYSADGRAVTIEQAWREESLGGTFDLATGEQLSDALNSDPIAFTQENANPAIVRLLAFGDGRVQDAVLSPDGALVAVVGLLRGDPGAALQLWDAATGEQIAQVQFERAQAGAISFSADGTQIAMTNDATSVYGVPDLNLISTSPFGWYTLSPDGTTAAYLNEEFILTLEHLATGEMRATPLDGLRTRDILRMFFSPDSAALYLVKRSPTGAVFVVDAASGTLLPGVGGFALNMSNITFNPDSTQIVTAELDFYPAPYASFNPGNGLRILDLAAGRSTQFIPANIPNEVAISIDGALAYTSNRTIHLVYAGETFTLTNDEFPMFIQHLEFSPDGALLATDVAGRLLLLDGRTLDLVAELPVSSASPFWGDGVLWNETTVIYADASVVRLWDTESGQEVAALDQGLPIRGLAIHAASRTLAVNVGTTEAQEMRLWNLSSSVPTAMAAFPMLTFRDDLAFNADGRLLAAGLNTTGDYVGPSTVIYDVMTGAVVHELNDCGLPLEFSPDGRLFACVSPVGSVFVYGVR